MRQSSKTMAIANRSAFSSNEVLQAPFLLAGELSGTQYVGNFKVTGRAVYLAGIQAYYRVPPGSPSTSVRIGVYSADDVRQAGSSLILNGVTRGQRILFRPDVYLAPDSIWHLKVELLQGDVNYLPADLEITYLYRYNPGPAPLAGHTVDELPQTGIGFWAVAETFVVT